MNTTSPSPLAKSLCPKNVWDTDCIDKIFKQLKSSLPASFKISDATIYCFINKIKLQTI